MTVTEFAIGRSRPRRTGLTALCILGGSTPFTIELLCDFGDALQTQRVVDAMKQAIRTGRPQCLDTLSEAA